MPRQVASALASCTKGGGAVPVPPCEAGSSEARSQASSKGARIPALTEKRSCSSRSARASTPDSKGALFGQDGSEFGGVGHGGSVSVGSGWGLSEQR